MAEGKPIGSIKLGVSLSGTEFGNTLDDINRQLKVSESTLKTNMKAFDNVQKSVDALSQKQKDLTVVSEGYDKKVQALTKRLADQEGAEVRNEKAIANTKKALNDAIANTKKALNDAIAKQNAYESQLANTKKELIYAEEGVNDLSQALKDNERAMSNEVKALKDAGDSAGAFEAKQKGLAKQSDLLKSSIDAQERVIKRLASEFGASSDEVQKAEKSLQSLKNQSNITEKQLDSLKNATTEVADNFEDSAGATDVFQGSLMAEFATAGLDKVKEVVSDIISNLNEASKQYNLLKAQLGSGVDVSELQQNIQNVFQRGFGDSIEEVQEGMVAIKQMLPDLKGTELETLTQNAIAFSKATGSDINETIRGAVSLINNFGVDATQAFDLLNAGAQNGLNRTDELTDNLAEYGQLWSQAGFSAEDMFAILDNGLKNGAFNLDKVNDFVKEFTISLSDGRIEENLGSFSTGTQELFKQFKDGKATSQDVFNSVINDFKSMTNEQDKATLASTVWSSLGEDNSLKVIEALNNTNDTYKKVKGTTEEVNKAMSNSEPFEALKRNMAGTFTPFSEEISGMKSKVTDFINNAFQNFPTASSLGLGVLTAGITLLGGAFLVALVPAGVFSAIMTALGVALGVLTSPITLTIAAIALLVGAFVSAYQNIKPFRDFIDDLLERIRIFSEKIYNEYIKPAFDEVVRAFTELANNIKTWWNENGAQFIQALKTFFSMVWAFMQPALQAWGAIFGATFKTIIELVKVAWDTIKGTFSGAFTIIKGLLDIFIGVFTGDWSRVWEGVKSVASGVWKVMTSGFSGFVNGIKALAGGIGSAIAGGIGGAVNGVIDAINWVLDKLGASRIAHVTWGSSGGSSGSGGRSRQAAYYANGTEGHTGGNAVVNDGNGAELVVNPNGSAFIPSGRNVFIPQMAKGTRVFTAEQTASLFGKNSPTFHYASGVGNSILNFAGDILDFIKDPVGLLKSVASKMVGFGNLWQPWLGMAKGGINYVMDSAKSYLSSLFKKKEESERVSYNASAGVEQWRGLSKKALQMEGQYSESNLTRLLYQMQTESGGNPNAVNNWDINARNGVPSKGLLQVILPTFRAYARPGYDKSQTDPLSNILASIRYAVSRYGSLASAYRGVGYANGGIITKQHLAMVGEGNKPEVVIPLDSAKRSRAMQLLAKTKQLMGINDNIIVNTNNNQDQSEVISLLAQQNQLLMQLLAKDSNVYMDGKKVNKELDSVRKDSSIIDRKRLGLI